MVMKFIAPLALALTPVAAAAQDDVADDFPGEGAYAGILKPSEVFYSLWTKVWETYNASQENGTEYNQREIVYPYLALIDTGINDLEEDPVERLSAAEILFTGFAPAPARVRFDTLADRDDWIGAYAMRRIMLMEFRVKENHDGVRDMVEDYVARFEPSPLNTSDVSFTISDIVTLDFNEGRGDQAADLLIREINRYPADAAYSAFTQPMRFEEQLAEAERLEDVKSALRVRLADMKAARADLAAKPDLASEDPVVTGDYPAWMWVNRFEPGETFMDARLRRLDRDIEQLEEWLSA